MLTPILALCAATWGLPEADPLRASHPPFSGNRAMFHHRPPSTAPIVRASRSPDATRDWDIQHYDIEVRLDPDQRQADIVITIQADARADSPSELLLHATTQDIHSVTVDGAAVDWTLGDDSVLRVPATGQQTTVVVDYSTDGNSSGTGYGLNWGDPLFSMHEPYGARNWLVVYDEPDDKATLTWTITAPSERVVVANGELNDQVDNGDDTTTWTYDFPWPIPTYLMVLDAGSYEVSTDDSGDVPVLTYAAASQIDAAASDFANTGQMITWLGELWGPYVWPHYANVLAPLSGAMEHTTATTFGQDMVGNGYAQLINVHELGHHWWGDWVSPAEWEEIWLNEGFASYTEVLWVEHTLGEDSQQQYLAWQRQTYFDWQQYEGVSTLYDPLFMWGGLVYDKGSWVVHMLRTVIGDDAFFDGLRAYGDAHAFDVATTEDLRLAMESSSGQDLSWFFDEWVYTAGDPEYVVGMTQTQNADGTWQIDVHIAQDTDDTWAMPMDVSVALSDGTTVDQTVWTEGAHSVTSLCLSAEATDIVFDPASKLLYRDMTVDDSRFEPAAPACDPPADSAPEEPAGGCACSATPRRGSWLWLVVASGVAISSRYRGRRSSSSC